MPFFNGTIPFIDHDHLPPDPVLFGQTERMKVLKRRLTDICMTRLPVLLQGEVGVGKATLSRFLNHHSGGNRSGYAGIDCATLTADVLLVVFRTLLNSSFMDSAGKDADHEENISTLFLKQACDLPTELQGRLALLLAEHDKHRRRPIFIIGSSTRDLQKETRQGRFRRDLFDRLAILRFEVPPLRKRLEDLPIITEYVRQSWCEKLEIRRDKVPEKLMENMIRYDWPGNIFELESFVGRFVALGPKHCGLPGEPRDAETSEKLRSARIAAALAKRGRQTWRM